MQSLWMLFASFMFAIMGVCVKLASVLYTTPEIVMYRGLAGVLFVGLYVRLQHGTLRTAYPLQHLWRGLIGVTSLWCWFISISLLPLATAMTLNYLSPVWMVTILFAGSWWRKQAHFEWGPTLAIIMSFIGVTLLLQPAFHADQMLGALFGLSSSVFSALAYLQVRQLGRLGEPDYRVVFYFSAIGAIAGMGGTLLSSSFSQNPVFFWHGHTMRGALLLLAIGVSATVAQVAMTRAYRLGNTLITANLQYAGIVFSSIWGIVIWSDLLGWVGWLGIFIIIASGLIATGWQHRAAVFKAR